MIHRLPTTPAVCYRCGLGTDAWHPKEEFAPGHFRRWTVRLRRVTTTEGEVWRCTECQKREQQ